MKNNEESSDEEFYDCQNEVNSPINKDQGGIFLDPIKAYAKLKGIKGARLKYFFCYDEALNFVSTPIEDRVSVNIYPPSPKPDVESSPYSSVNQPTLNKFRALINKGDVNSVKEMLAINPLVLVTSADTPTLLQIALRYNAFHVAAFSGRADILYVLLDCLNSVEFWKRIYPNATQFSTNLRMQYVIDLYLNSPELGNFETPLHFACKFGHLACVTLLVRHPLTSLNSLNKTGQTPLDLSGSRFTKEKEYDTIFYKKIYGLSLPFEIEVTEKIKNIFNEKYLLLVDSFEDTVFQKNVRTKVLPPLCTRTFQTILGQCASNVCSTFSKLTGVLPLVISNNGFMQVMKDITDLEYQVLRLRGFAGPISSGLATIFRNKWIDCNSLKGSAKQFALLRLTDSERGYERQGRYLSRLFGTHWFEYWDFLNDFVDLSTDDGCMVVEEFLASKVESQNRCKNADCGLDNADSYHLNSIPKFSTLDEVDICTATPIKKLEAKEKASKLDFNWLSYRSPDNIMLEDSLEDKSTELTDLDVSHHEQIGTKSNINISPIVNFLEKITLKSPQDGGEQIQLYQDEIVIGTNENFENSVDKCDHHFDKTIAQDPNHITIPQYFVQLSEALCEDNTEFDLGPIPLDVSNERKRDINKFPLCNNLIKKRTLM